jgi:MFS family permease
MYFFGWAGASLFLPRIPDINGRRIFYIVNTFVLMVLYVAIIFVENLIALIVLFFLFGFCVFGR